MNAQRTSLGSRAVLLLLASGICAALFVYVYTYQGYQLLQMYPPDWSAFGVLKAFTLLIASMFVFVALCPALAQQRKLGWDTLPACLPAG